MAEARDDDIRIVNVRNVKRGKEGTEEIRIFEKMSELRHSDYSNQANIKIVRDEHGEMIKTAQGILCEEVDRDGNTTLKFLQTTSNASSSAADNNLMPRSTAFRNEKTIGKENESNIWSDGDCKELLQLYYENIGQVGPFAKFKNKKQMWEFISNKITTKCSSSYSPTQCENKYKN
ncbi:uncharacterized protein LOC143896434, partial [Temnothorax americanus]|uniref:uncharacterized protein LOC143896434 n=1 Tax=Temnothorax americanus TaxID=1964332 RepID=UPI004068AA01